METYIQRFSSTAGRGGAGLRSYFFLPDVILSADCTRHPSFFSLFATPLMKNESHSHTFFHFRKVVLWTKCLFGEKSVRHIVHSTKRLSSKCLSPRCLAFGKTSEYPAGSSFVVTVVISFTDFPKHKYSHLIHSVVYDSGLSCTWSLVRAVLATRNICFCV